MKSFLQSIFVVLVFSNLAIAQLPTNVPTNGLEAWWGFNANSADSSGNGNHLTNNGAVGATDRYSNSNSALAFNGTSNYLTIAAPSFQFGETSSFSISFWVNHNSTTGGWVYGSGLNLAQGGSGRFCHFSAFTSFPTLQWRTNEQGSPWIIASASNHAINVWEHWVFVYVNKSMTMYKNGVQAGTATYTYTGATTASMPFHIGTLFTQAGSFFPGSMDDFGIWSRALTQAEIDLLYINCNAGVSTQPSDFASAPGGDAQFGVGIVNPGLTFQWQSDNSGSFQDLSNNTTYQGVNADTLNITSVTAAMNGTNFRCIVSDPNVCQDTSMSATLEICGTVTNQPISQSILVNTPVAFGVSSSDTGASYQWQFSAGGAFSDLINATPYSGVKSDTLKISNPTFSYDGNQYRCIVNSSICFDTSSIAILNVTDGTSLMERALLKVQVFPNPAKDALNLSIPSTYLNSNFRITNTLGQSLYSGKLTDINMALDLSEFAVGNYILVIEDKDRITFSVID